MITSSLMMLGLVLLRLGSFMAATPIPNLQLRCAEEPPLRRDPPGPHRTQGKEDVPLSCVNEIDNTPPPQVAYSKERIPGKGVYINTSWEFLVGCDCKDGCRDK